MRNWVFTINNPTTDKLLKTETQCKFLIATLEIAETGTIHYQGYLETTHSRTLDQVKALFVDNPHLEPRVSTKAKAIAYTLKTVREALTGTSNLSVSAFAWPGDTNLLLTTSTLKPIVTIPSTTTCDELISMTVTKLSTSEELSSIQQEIKDGKPMEDIADDHFKLWVKYNNSFTKYALLQCKPRNFKTEVTVIVGPTGTGKSRYCANLGNTTFWKPRGNWWDGYERQHTVIIDEFYGWLPYDLLLRLCDRYPLNVEIKGGTINFSPKAIIITSNKRPNEWYSNVYFESFIRRVEQWIYMPTQQDAYTYTDYNTFNTSF